MWSVQVPLKLKKGVFKVPAESDPKLVTKEYGTLKPVGALIVSPKLTYSLSYGPPVKAKSQIAVTV